MNSNRRRVRGLGMAVGIAVCAAGLVGAGGCESARAPRFEHAATSVIERTAEGVAVSFVLDAYNENDIALPLRDIEYELELDGETVFRGKRSAEATLRRRGVQQVELPAVVAIAPGAAAPEGVLDFRLSGRVTYVTPGRLAELLFDTGVRVPSSWFEAEGQVDLGAAK